MNVFTAIGRIGKDAAVRYTQAGKPVAGWSLAVDSGYGDNKTTLWLDCSLWGQRAEKIGEYIKKGDRLGVTGEIGTREHEGKTYITLRVQDVTLLGERTQNGNNRTQNGNVRDSGTANAGEDFVDGDVPF